MDGGALDDRAKSPVYPTSDEAIAVALAEMSPGDTLTIHDDGCRYDGERDVACTCEPVVCEPMGEA